ncbi:phosphonate ABC transporter ATP-binding protein [Terrihabitans sp. B22-R8]|uniref:phosphonate ABC transporter ATP-binding protein n=1 Tax=Terrihabitans sp. B22-R8 TaxID=3425128 RepID=UPI00403C7E1C
MSAAISLRNISKSYGAVTAVDGVTLSIAPGERVALIGASGSGKSTLIRIASGLLTADREPGDVHVMGQLVQANGKLAPNVRAVRRHIGLIFQKFNLVNRLTVETNVLVGALGRNSALRGLLGLFSREDRENAHAALAEVGVADHRRKRAEQLSGGQQQRVAIARALVQQAGIIVADEPIASLDPKSAKRVMDILAGLNRKKGITLLVSLHQVDYARAYFDRVVAMRAGRVVFDGPAAKLTPEFLTELYGASAEELILPGQIGPTEDLEGGNLDVQRTRTAEVIARAS